MIVDWFPVTTVPTTKGFFLCCLSNEWPRVLTYRGGHWIRDGIYYDKRVTHWTPLPELPTC